MKISYTPEGPMVGDPQDLFPRAWLMLNELVSSKELIWRLFLRDFSSKYRQSLLGIFWAVLMPLITVGFFVGMNRSGILTIEDVGIPYPLFAIIGLTIWNLFTIGLSACANSIVGAGSMVVKINFPKVALIFAASVQGIVEFFIRAVLVALTFIYFGVAPDWGGLLLGLACLIPLYLIMVGAGFVFSLAVTVLRDIMNVLNLTLMGVMLLTPILYPIKGDTVFARANVWNPFYYLVNVPRDFIINGHTEFITEFLWTTLFSIAVFLFGWNLFYLAQSKIAERI